ncbi:MAG: polyphosphate polymerase domain-containing protein [Clostridia bacterium]|nr:polyphosphate polymerase domain-containing protein [Clostridia bacterium]
MGKGYRHELKFVMTEGEATFLGTRLRLTMAQDAHAARQGGSYFIRSLYFDDPYETGVGEKIAGVEFRDKYRIRIYNLSDSAIKLERKHKNNIYIKKDSISLTRNECEAIIAGEYSFLLHRKEKFAQEMFAAFRLRHLRPKVLVDYDREPYVFPIEDVRVTFDRNIRTSMRPKDIFDPNVITYPATSDPSLAIVEVKFNRYLPAYIRMLLQVDAADHTAASKYVFCRQFDV